MAIVERRWSMELESGSHTVVVSEREGGFLVKLPIFDLSPIG